MLFCQLHHWQHYREPLKNFWEVTMNSGYPNTQLQCSDELKYLRPMKWPWGLRQEIIASGDMWVFWIQRALQFKRLPRKAIIMLYKTVLRPTVTYESETWKKYVIRHHKSLGKNNSPVHFGPKSKWEEYGKYVHQDLKDLYGEVDVVAFLNLCRIRWFEHVKRMDPKRIPKELLYGQPGSDRKIGSPRLRWLDDVERDLKDIRIHCWRRLRLIEGNGVNCWWRARSFMDCAAHLWVILHQPFLLYYLENDNCL